MKTYIIDSFADQPFKGNPAGVCILTQHISEEKMQHIAHELGLSETAFIKKLEAEGTYSIRYFSPIKEIPLCGHATLASAKIVFDSCTKDELHFITHSGVDLITKRDGEAIAMEFPTFTVTPATVNKATLEALGLDTVSNCTYNEENNILLLEIEGTEVLKNLKPDFVSLEKSSNNISGVLVTSLSNDEEYDFQSRYFWPWSGSNEDPVTGASHTFLAPYWGKKLGKTKMKSFQASKRTGFMSLELLPNNKLIITGTAASILEGTMLV